MTAYVALGHRHNRQLGGPLAATSVGNVAVFLLGFDVIIAVSTHLLGSYEFHWRFFGTVRRGNARSHAAYPRRAQRLQAGVRNPFQPVPRSESGWSISGSRHLVVVFISQTEIIAAARRRR
jgi:hypothetical protein